MIATPRFIPYLTITCDNCENTATHTFETRADFGFAVHWTCREHLPEA